MLHQKSFFLFFFYLVWFDVGNDQSNDLTKKEKNPSLYSLAILQCFPERAENI